MSRQPFLGGGVLTPLSPSTWVVQPFQEGTEGNSQAFLLASQTLDAMPIDCISSLEENLPFDLATR